MRATTRGRPLVAANQVYGRTIKKFVRTPALIIAGTAQGVLFLLDLPLRVRRGGGPHGGLSYVDFLVPGFVVTGVLFQGMGASTGRGRGLAGRPVRPVALAADPPAVDRDGTGGRGHDAWWPGAASS